MSEDAHVTGQDNTRLGILLMILVTIVFSVQDGISQHLASRYNVIMVVMIRYWFFCGFCHCTGATPTRRGAAGCSDNTAAVADFSWGFVGG